METQNTGRYTAIDLLKIVLTVGIVFRHAELVGLTDRSAAFALTNRIMMAVSETFVPLFFALSGFLYFRNVPKRPTADFFLQKSRSRLSSLVVPYLIANAIAFCAYWLAHRFAPEMMSGFFGEDWRNPVFVFWTGPVNLSLWFIRDLIIACLVAPLIYLLVRYLRFWGVLALGIVWFGVYSTPWYNLYFTIGAWVAVCHGERADRWLGNLHCRVPRDAAAWCFFIYLYHYIPVLVLKKLVAAFVDPHSFVALTVSYLGTAVITLAVVSAVYLVLKKVAPRPTRVLVGGKL